MRLIFGLVLVLGLGLAGAAAYLAQGYISQTQAELARERAAKARAVPTVEVFVANKALKFGDTLTPDDVVKISWPQNALPETIFTDGAVLFPANDPRPRVIVRPMARFEPLMAINVTEPGEDAGLTSRLEKGMRAFAIKVDVSSGVSGFLRPSNVVDVYWTGSNGAGGGDLTRLIEQTVKIVAVDQSAENDWSNQASIARTVTVEATPQQVARLAQAQATGRLALSLVGEADDTVIDVVEVDSKGLLGIQAQQVVEVVKERVCTVRTRKGADVVEMPIPCTN